MPRRYSLYQTNGLHRLLLATAITASTWGLILTVVTL